MCSGISLLFYLHFSGHMMWYVFSYAYWPSVYLSSLVRCLLRSMAHFFLTEFYYHCVFFFKGLLLCFKSLLYILDFSPLSDISFASVCKSFQQNVAETMGHPHTKIEKKKVPRNRHYILYKSQLKMNHRHICKMQHYKTLRR